MSCMMRWDVEPSSWTGPAAQASAQRVMSFPRAGFHDMCCYLHNDHSLGQLRKPENITEYEEF
jgi:hypothetical protein